MRSRRKGKKLGRRSNHRISMLNNLAMSLFKYGRIKTTIDRAKEASRHAEKLITMAKKGTLNDRRLAGRYIKQKDLLKKLFDEIAPLFQGRPGGYTRVLHLAPRPGDGADMGLLELVVRPVSKEEEEAVEIKDEETKDKKKKSVTKPKKEAKVEKKKPEAKKEVKEKKEKKAKKEAK
ncbi:50S ribosomal protein L17 [bacterium]|nr:50S ribosomal protein L17 [bacterium]